LILTIPRYRRRDSALVRVLFAVTDVTAGRGDSESGSGESNWRGWHIDDRDRRKATPRQARHFIDTMRSVFEWAAEAQLIKADPTAGVKYPKQPKTDGFIAWTRITSPLTKAVGQLAHVSLWFAVTAPPP